MQGSTLTRSLLVSVSLVIAGPAMAQSSDKEPATSSKQSNAKSTAAKPAAAPKRLDFVPTNGVKQTTTQAPAPGTQQPAQMPAKQDSHCHSQDSDA